MKKLMSAALLLAVILTACGEAASAPVSAGGTAAAPDAAAETAAETAEEAKAYIPDSLPDADLGGYKFRIGTSEFGGKNLNEYVIFDDMAELLMEQEDNYVHIDPRHGVTQKDIDKAREIFTTGIWGKQD